MWQRSSANFLRNTIVSGQFEIERGDSFGKVYKMILGDQKTPPYFFQYLTKVEKMGVKVNFGYYEADNITLEQLLQNIADGKQTLERVTFPEGFNMYEVATALDRAGLANRQAMLNVFTDRDVVQRLTGKNYATLEGFLAPGTYFFPKKFPPERIAATMVNEFFRTLPPDFEAKAAKQGLSFYDAIILASIVQKETYCADESPLVASVFLNRIKVRMRLQADPTIIYGIYEDFDGRIRRVHLNDKENRYNTYQHSGLTPTPIASPSPMALNAVINPADSKYFYFVARKDGTHVFSRTYEEHRRNVRIHQLGMSN
jgi:UPF0755 protein